MRARAPSIAKVTRQIDIGARSENLAALFKANYRRGPWPSAAQCYRLANTIDIIRIRASPKRDYQNVDPGFKKRLATVSAMQRLIEKQKKEAAQSILDLQLPGPLQDARDLTALKAVLDQATPALLRPFDPKEGRREDGWWHKAARIIAAQAREALAQAGQKKVSVQKQGAFVKVVAAALKLALGEDFEPETVANVLTKITN